MGCCCLFSIFFKWILLPVGAYFLFKFLFKKWSQMRMEKVLEQFGPGKTPKDIVIVHRNTPGKTMPSLSPFVMKLETYLRMAGIKYEIDTKNRYGPKGKFPWISLNGEHIPDSQLAIQFLAKKFEKDFSKDVDAKSLAMATLCRVSLEEHCFWGLALERFIFEGEEIFKLTNLPYPAVIIKFFLPMMLMKRAKAQGIGLHSEDEIYRLMEKNLRAISTLLGDKKFICGDNPCEDDCGIFGLLSQVVWTVAKDSKYDKLIKGELKNLEEYCNRMKAKFWPDWDQQLDKL